VRALRACRGDLAMVPTMRLRSNELTAVRLERDVYDELLPLANARVAELGCGRAEHTRAIAEAHPDARIVAFEIDAIQHARNVASAAPPNVRFAAGGAESIAADDGSFDIVLMFKSLHHVPAELLDHALREIHRVLAPNGLAYFSEPVFAGEYNELIRIFHDEERVRAEAFAALERAVASGDFTLVAERFHAVAVRFDSFAQFEERVIGVTYVEHRLSETQHAAVERRFMRNMKADGAVFLQQMRVDLLRRAA
jgi:SAM-dependent methyltransferase